ncbi:MAG: DUF455 family protein [Myxococcota bacterium]
MAATVEAWARDYVLSTSLAHKLSPPPRPRNFSEDRGPERLLAPGRPAELKPKVGRQKSPRPGALVHPKKRAQLLHTFFHHELQAAELMAWALLAFPETPRAFRRGLLQIMADEIRHAGLYAEHLAALGFPVGSFPINDWLWTKAAQATSPAHFVATLGLGFEGGNLDHAARFERLLGEAKDEKAAALEALVGEEEVAHVAFGVRWFRRFTGGLDFDRWRAHLPAPLSPALMRGHALDLKRRRRSGLTEDFLARLEAWDFDTPGS